MNTTPNGIRTESERIRLVSIDVRHATPLHAFSESKTKTNLAVCSAHLGLVAAR